MWAMLWAGMLRCPQSLIWSDRPPLLPLLAAPRRRAGPPTLPPVAQGRATNTPTELLPRCRLLFAAQLGPDSGGPTTAASKSDLVMFSMAVHSPKDLHAASRALGCAHCISPDAELVQQIKSLSSLRPWQLPLGR